ncbi:MAG: adenylate/guanylate cyclase domain-containing protein [Bacteroidota bacterium]
MKFIQKRRWRIIRDYCISWTLACLFLSIVRGTGTTQDSFLKFDLLSSLMISFTIGPILGAVSGYTQIRLEEQVKRYLSLQDLLLRRFGYTLLFLTVMVLISWTVYRLYFEAAIGLLEFVFEPGSLAIIFYVLVVDIVLAVGYQVKLMLGASNLGKLLWGKFYVPREEERIFMFLDLKSSTKLAEQLGHIEFSKLIQDCFNDLGVVVENEAEIYKYVGDEAILTWKLRAGISNQNCLKAFFNFKQQLTAKEKYYQEKYGCRPIFKAGLHAGVITVTEVGKYKKGIAYHGDTINTAARIQGMCNDLQQELLISQYVKDQLDGSGFEFKLFGSQILRGKKQGVPIYGVLENKASSVDQ